MADEGDPGATLDYGLSLAEEHHLHVVAVTHPQLLCCHHHFAVPAVSYEC